MAADPRGAVYPGDQSDRIWNVPQIHTNKPVDLYSRTNGHVRVPSNHKLSLKQAAFVSYGLRFITDIL